MIRARGTLAGLLAGAAAAGLLAQGCGGGGGGSDPVPTGTVTVTLTDAPTDTLQSLVVTIDEVSLIGGQGGAVPIPLPEGQPFTEDLLSLDGINALLSQAAVPAGTYTKIRLGVTGAVATFPDGTSQSVTIVGNGKVELLCSEGIEVVAGESITIALDFDVEESIKLTETGNGELILRPEVFVDCDGDGDVDGGTDGDGDGVIDEPLPPPQPPPPQDEMPILEGLHALVVETDPSTSSFVCMAGHHDEPHTDAGATCSCQSFRLRVVADAQTIIMDQDGAELNFAAIQPGQIVELEGIMQAATAAGGQMLAFEVTIMRDLLFGAGRICGFITGLDRAQGLLTLSLPIGPIGLGPVVAPPLIHFRPDVPVHFLRERLSAADLAFGQRVCIRGGRVAANGVVEAGRIRIKPERFVGVPVAPADAASRTVPVFALGIRFFHMQLFQVNVLCRPDDPGGQPLIVHLGPNVAQQVVTGLRPGRPAGFFGRLVPHVADASDPFPVRFLALGVRPIEERRIRARVLACDPAARTFRIHCEGTQDIFVSSNGASAPGDLDCRFPLTAQFADGLTALTLASAVGDVECEGHFERVPGGRQHFVATAIHR